MTTHHLAAFNVHADSLLELVLENASRLVTDACTVLAGQGLLSRGTLLGKVAATGKYVKSLAASLDGSQTPVAVLFVEVDATADDAPGLICIRGDLNAAAVMLGAGHTLASVSAGLADLGIFLRSY